MPTKPGRFNQVVSPLILTLDIGTSSTRAILYDAQARPVPDLQAQISHQMRTTPDGGAEFAPAELFAGVAAAVDRLLQLAGPLAGQIGGVDGHSGDEYDGP